MKIILYDDYMLMKNTHVFLEFFKIPITKKKLNNKDNVIKLEDIDVS